MRQSLQMRFGTAFTNYGCRLHFVPFVKMLLKFLELEDDFVIGLIFFDDWVRINKNALACQDAKWGRVNTSLKMHLQHIKPIPQ